MAALSTANALKVAGTIRVPGDKSISHRALLFAALAEGESRIRDILPSADVHSTVGVLRAMGVEVPELAPGMVVRGPGARGLRSPTTDLDCGNSGTTTRLVAGIVAGTNFAARFIGDASLSRRPMRRIQRPLEQMGARFDIERGEGLPMTVYGAGESLEAIDWVSDTASAQVKSAILLAGVVGGVRVSVREPARSRDHTERMLAARGVSVIVDDTTVTLGGGTMRPLDTVVPGDPSSAAFFAALAALANQGELRLENVCVNPTRAGFLQVLASMGAVVEELDRRDEGGEPVATIRVAPGALHGTSVGGSIIPTMIDELPLLACLGARAAGETVITGAEELRVKESDRITAVVENLRAIGVEAEELPDGMRIIGSDRALKGRVVTHGDHRLAMAFGILGALPGNAIEVDDPACVAVSYPQFWTDLANVSR